MDYNLLICASNKQWMAIDVNKDGACDRISFDGNEIMEVDSVEMVADFCKQILDYYNIDAFDDIAINVKVVVLSEYSSLITDLFMSMKDTKSINVIDSKSIIPIYVLKNCIVKPGGTIDVRCLEDKKSLLVDNDFIVSYVSDKAGEEIIMNPEWFSTLFRFDCRNLISDENELKALEEKCAKTLEKKQNEIDEYQRLYSELQNKYDELEKCYIQLQNEVKENKAKIVDKRKILWFSEKQLQGTDLSPSSSYSGIMLGTFFTTNIMNSTNKKYVCKWLKQDGDFVKKGSRIIEIKESYSVGDGVSRDTGRKCIIKAADDGRIFYLVSNNSCVQNNQAVVLSSDSADNRTDLMKWYKEMK